MLGLIKDSRINGRSVIGFDGVTLLYLLRDVESDIA